MNKGKLYIISAPSGAGKTSLVKKLIAEMQNLIVSVSHTTRQSRKGEIHGRDYFFVSVDEFLAMKHENAFLEYAQVFDNFYGTAQQTVETHLEQVQDVILEIDWQGAQQVRRLIPSCVSIFIFPPSIEILRQRLESRGKDDSDVIARRMRDAVAEMSHYDEFDYLFVKDNLNVSFNEFKIIVIENGFIQTREAFLLEPLLMNLLE